MIEKEFENMLNELKAVIFESSLPSPEIYFKEIESQKIVNVVIDDSENYVDYLNIFSGIVNNIYYKYDLDLEILLFERGEIKIPFNEQGFKRLNNEEFNVWELGKEIKRLIKTKNLWIIRVSNSDCPFRDISDYCSHKRHEKYLVEKSPKCEWVSCPLKIE